MQAKGRIVSVENPQHVVILGAGSIGVSFAACFADTGWMVTLCDPDAGRRQGATAGISAQAAAMDLAGLARKLGGQIAVVRDAQGALALADLVIECGPERLETKQAIFANLLDQTAPQAILATASSAITVSRILPDPAQQARCLVAHPVNPPAVLRLIELAPAPGTVPGAIKRAAELFGSAGFESVTLGHEVEGFVMNRLQGAVLREAYRLLDEGVADVAGIDSVIRKALGPRWALSGPFETAELNTPGGIRAHADRMGPAYKRMGEERGETVDWHDALVARVEAQRRAICAADDLPARVQWRSSAVARLVAVRDKLLGDVDG